MYTYISIFVLNRSDFIQVEYAFILCHFNAFECKTNIEVSFVRLLLLIFFRLSCNRKRKNAILDYKYNCKHLF